MPSRYTIQIDNIIKRLQENGSNVNEDLIRKAYEFAFEAHKNVFRRSGKPYIEHPVMVSEILSELNVDDITIAAALLHDVVEDTDISGLEIRENFGETIYQIVDGVTKIDEINFGTLEEKQAENFRKLIISMIKDIRVIIIKFADRLHNMRTIKFMSVEKQKKIAKETLEIYAPLAYRLGMYKIKSELEDLSFELLEPENFKMIKNKIELSYDKMESVINKIQPLIISKLSSQNIESTVNGRIKHFYSIFKKLKTRKSSFEEIMDIIAIRIIIPKEEDCYKVLSIVHEMFSPVHKMFHDYIAAPKENGYQSLHTKVIFENKIIEIQIRSTKMHEIAECGLAAHWKYKRTDMENDHHALDKYIIRLRGILQESFESKDPKEFLEELKINLISGEIFVFTPKKDLITLPVGSTPVDFAYKIHENIGNHCIAAKVSGQIIPLYTPLENGNVVEIITSNKFTPTYNWLKFAKSPRARTSIKHFLKKIEFNKTLKLGRETFYNELEKYKIKPDRDIIRQTSSAFGYKTIEEFYNSIGNGVIKPIHFMRKISSFKKEGMFEKLIHKIRLKSRDKREIFNTSVENAKMINADCCHPLPGDSIVGEIVDEMIIIHIANCSKIGAVEPQNLININWETEKYENYDVKFKVAAEDRQQLLLDMIKALNSLNINLSHLVIKVEDSIAVAEFIAKVKNLNHFIKLRKKLLGIKSVLSVERFLE
ncbi:MAG: bifunctional (p)ppGpp synthetase/guanosine-3',5'-bis(diphosphate) 3'-pyrophosphohydrolase [Candidatus Delongbacteria bacterium]|nr:bifunctional (p)ppGpp synthetase/guanosine-3',5'-bis(diphosphate) 3'-pyrophosphohydrolase [Candidatus Delongbacteria bacterium]